MCKPSFIIINRCLNQSQGHSIGFVLDLSTSNFCGPVAHTNMLNSFYANYTFRLPKP